MKEYEYRVTAINDGGESDSSECSKPIKAKPLKGKANSIDIYLCTDNTTLLSSHRGCSKDKIRPTLVLRPSTILSMIIFIISYSNNVLSSHRHLLKLQVGELMHNH